MNRWNARPNSLLLRENIVLHRQFITRRTCAQLRFCLEHENEMDKLVVAGPTELAAAATEPGGAEETKRWAV